MRFAGRWAGVVALLMSGVMLSAQSGDHKPASEPRSFYEDDDGSGHNPFDHPVALPQNVLDALRATPEARERKQDLTGYSRRDFAAIFKAVKIHLAGPEEIDYVVMSELPLAGASAPWFWIVRYDPVHPQVIFFTFANGFYLRETTHNGYPDIVSTALTAAAVYTNIYHYDGQRYVAVHQYHKEQTY